MFVRLFPKFYKGVLRRPDSHGVLMLIRILPMHPSPHVSFYLAWWLVDVIGGWIVLLMLCLDEVVWSYIWLVSVGVGWCLVVVSVQRCGNKGTIVIF